MGPIFAMADVAATIPPPPGRLSLPEICTPAGDLLRPLFEKQIVLPNDTEKRLLVSRTKLYNILEAFQGNFDSDSISDNCLSILSRFVQHICGKFFVALSSFLLEDGSHWKGFVKTLYHTLGEAILKSIVKTLKLEEIHRDGAYLSVLSEYMLGVNWDILHGLFMNEHEANKDSDEVNASVGVNGNCLELKAVLLGAIVRLFCSFASDDWLEESSDSLSDELLSLYGFAKLVPKLLCWCFSFDVKYNSTSIVVYARQKIMVLMVRTSSYIIQEYPMLVLSLQLLQKYFPDVLALPLSQSKDGRFPREFPISYEYFSRPSNC